MYNDISFLSRNNKIIALWFKGQKNIRQDIIEHAVADDNSEVFNITKRWLDRYFDGKNPNANEIPIEPVGSDFQKMVWKILLDIPYGKVATYGQIASIVAKQKGISKMSAQAVGNAIGHNPISIIIPCHRVVGTNGNLTGYAGGIERKAKLLMLENHNIKTIDDMKDKLVYYSFDNF